MLVSLRSGAPPAPSRPSAAATGPLVEIIEERVSCFNRKYALRLRDGAAVEAVLYRGDSLCISTQVGCAVACPFCASGARGFGRNLSLAELEAQVEVVQARGAEVARVTLSGVGEPLHNLAAVEPFIRRSHAAGRSVSLTSSGGPLPRLGRLFELPHRGLTLSVHAGLEATRARAVPHGPALDPLFAALARLLESASVRRRRRVALAYLLIAGLNDDDADIEAFIARARPLGVPVHLFALNPVPTSALAGVPEARYQAVAARLRAAGFDTRRSSQARLDAVGGCGTLVAMPADRGAP